MIRQKRSHTRSVGVRSIFRCELISGHLGGLTAEQPIPLREPNLVAFATNIRGFPTGVLFSVAVEESRSDVWRPPIVTVSVGGLELDRLQQRAHESSTGPAERHGRASIGSRSPHWAKESRST